MRKEARHKRYTASCNLNNLEVGDRGDELSEMILATMDLCILAIGIWIACRTEQAIERGEQVHCLQLYAGGVLIIAALALLGWTLSNAMRSAFPTGGIVTDVYRPHTIGRPSIAPIMSQTSLVVGLNLVLRLTKRWF